MKLVGSRPCTLSKRRSARRLASPIRFCAAWPGRISCQRKTKTRKRRVIPSRSGATSVPAITADEAGGGSRRTMATRGRRRGEGGESETPTVPEIYNFVVNNGVARQVPPPVGYGILPRLAAERGGGVTKAASRGISVLIQCVMQREVLFSSGPVARWESTKSGEGDC